LREPRATKSFRDAADRIVRQESATPESISRLLGAPALSARRVTTDAEAWDVRLAALATIAQYDGLTFAAGRVEAAPAYNLFDDITADPAIRDAVDEVARSGATVQLRASLHLADGRIATAVLVTPLVPNDALGGALIALRVGRPFAAVDAYTAVGIAQLVSLELARSVDTRREGSERRQALALYELARHALFSEGLDEKLQAIASVVANNLDHDAAHIWLRHPDRGLRRHAAHPVERLTESIWENEHDALWGALTERRLVRMSAATAPWLPANTGEILVVPLRGEPRPLGVLVLARRHPAYGLDDIEMADVLGTFIGRVVSSAASSHAALAREEASSDLEREGELEESERAR